MRKRTGFSIVVTFLLLGCSAYCQSFGRHATLRIVSNHDGAPPVRFAVGELAKYLRLMGNAPPTLVESPEAGDIYVGMIPDNAAASESRAIAAAVRDNPDSFVIRTLGDALLIYGGSPRGNLYGVYHYLETLSIRWYFPGAGNEFVPHAPARLKGYNITQSPSFPISPSSQ